MLPLLLVVAAMAALGWAGANRALHPQPQVEDYAPEDFGLPVEEVEFPSRDGTPLAGWFLAGRQGAALALLHGYGRSRAELLPQAALLHRAGYSLLLFDFRHRGRSGGDCVTLGIKEPLDVLGALDYLRSRAEVDSERIGVLGVSLGAAAGIIAAANDPHIKLVVAEGAFHTLRSVIKQGMRTFVGLPPFPFAPIVSFIAQRRLGARVDDVVPEEAIGCISPRPVFIIHGLEDSNVPVAAARVLYWRAGEPKTLWLVPDGQHAQAYLNDPAEYERRVLGLLERYL